MIEILYQDSNFVLINKPVNRIIAAGRNTNEIALNRELEEQLGQRIWTIHRLDRETSGLLLFALTAEVHKELSLAFEQRQIQKEYVALCWGRIEPQQGCINFPLRKGRKHLMRICANHEKGMNAETSYSLMKFFDFFSLVKLTPKTGRTHQLRVHLAALGYPLLGDSSYYPTAKAFTPFITPSSEKEAPRVMLHAFALNFTLKEQSYSFQILPPKDFLAFTGKDVFNGILKKE